MVSLYQRFVDEAIAAIKAAMQPIRAAQLLPPSEHRADRKADLSVVTGVDHEAEAILRTSFSTAFPEVTILGEEGGGQFDEDGLTILVDGLDGSRPFTHGVSSSVVITGLCDQGRVVASVVGEPATGRLWAAWKDRGCYYFAPDGAGWGCTVWKGELGAKATVFLQVTRGSIRSAFYAKKLNGQIKIISASQMAKMVEKLSVMTRGTYMGPTGSNLALMASGGDGMVGCFCHANGGPWDLAPVILATEAGATATAYVRTQNGWGRA